MGRKLLFLALVLLPSIAASAEADAPRTVTKTYVAATFVPPEPDCYFSGPTFLNGVQVPGTQGVFQQACFPILDGEGNVTLAVHDVSGVMKVKGWYVFQDADGEPMMPEGWFCNGFSAPIPSNAETMFVVLWGFATIPCRTIPIPASVTTAGEVVATFTP